MLLKRNYMYIASVTLQPCKGHEWTGSSSCSQTLSIHLHPSSCLDMDCMYLLQGVQTDYRCCQPHALNICHACDNGRVCINSTEVEQHFGQAADRGSRWDGDGSFVYHTRWLFEGVGVINVQDSFYTQSHTVKVGTYRYSSLELCCLGPVRSGAPSLVAFVTA